MSRISDIGKVLGRKKVSNCRVMGMDLEWWILDPV